jgi:hypothetical protein
VKAEPFIDIDASRFEDGTRILAMRSISNSGIIDVVTLPSDGSPTHVAETVVDRLLPMAGPADRADEQAVCRTLAQTRALT